MAKRLHPLLSDGDFTAGPSGVQGKKIFLALDYADQGEAEEAARIECPEEIQGIPRGSISATRLAPGRYLIEAEYASGIRPQAEQGAGQSPPAEENPLPEGIDSQPASRPEAPPRQASEQIGAELSFSTGGGTERIYLSKRTIHAVARKANINDGAKAAPNFHRLIGVSQRGVEGCEVHSSACNFTVTKRFAVMELGYFMKLLKATAHTNEKAFCGFQPGEVLFFGADGGFRQGNDAPWQISGKFGMSPNRKNVKIDDEGLLTLPDVEGWNYVWTYNEKTTETIGGVTYEIERPRFAYCEQVYDKWDFKDLKLDF